MKHALDPINDGLCIERERASANVVVTSFRSDNLTDDFETNAELAEEDLVSGA